MRTQKPIEVAETPGGALKTFVSAIEQGNISLAATCVSRDACLITPDATAVNGRDAVRAILAQLVRLGIRIDGSSAHWVIAGDIALGRGIWRSRSAHNGTELAQQWKATFVLRRRDQAWRIQIIAPWEAVS